MIRSILILLVALSVNFAQAADTHVLTDTNGKPIECILLDYERGHVLLEMAGEKYSLPLSRFSPASNRAVLDWAADRALRNGEVRIHISGANRNSERDEDNRQIQHVNYEVTIQNDSKLDIDGLEVEYKIYWLDGRVEVSDPFYFWIDRGEVIKRLNVRERFRFETARITLNEREKRKDTSIGIWVRLYRNGQALHEVSYPSGLLQRVDWKNMSLEAIY
ncbi:MAG TPA: hypothetical protein DCX06_04165 [Opitutae bacterium]|nr:hypothetical protein [Opitutae bacterium]